MSEAIDSVLSQLQARLDDVDVAWVFCTADHREHGPQIAQQLLQELGAPVLIGCAGEGVIGSKREIERQPGLAVLAGTLPGVSVHPFHIATDDWRRLLAEPDALRQRFGCTDATRAIIGFGDPWTTPLNQLTGALDQISPHAPLIGGMASAARKQGENVLLCNDETFHEGFVGVSLGGALAVQAVVSQGARPIGQPMIITKAHENVVEQLGGKPAMQVLRAIFQDLSERDRELMQHGLLIGRAISEYRESFGRGDFLVRNITGADQETGAMALTDYVRIGQTVQFHVRDEESADEDLRLMLESAAKGSQAAAALLFSCNGRGSRMFGAPNHDISVANQQMPSVPVAGFFAAGEIGPVGGKNFVHGHTASFALLRQAE